MKINRVSGDNLQFMTFLLFKDKSSKCVDYKNHFPCSGRILANKSQKANNLGFSIRIGKKRICIPGLSVRFEAKIKKKHWPGKKSVS